MNILRLYFVGFLIRTNKHITNMSLCESSWYHSTIHTCEKYCFWLKCKQNNDEWSNGLFWYISGMRSKLDGKALTCGSFLTLINSWTICSRVVFLYRIIPRIIRSIALLLFFFFKFIYTTIELRLLINNFVLFLLSKAISQNGEFCSFYLKKCIFV